MIYPALNNEQNTNNQINSLPTPRVYKVYPRRFAILGIFCICSLSSGFQWIQYVFTCRAGDGIGHVVSGHG